MAIRTVDEIMEAVKSRIGEDMSDEAISFVEDVSDTLRSLSERKEVDDIDWKKRYEDNDAEWRLRYRDRFFNRDETVVETKETVEPEEETTKTDFDELFESEEK